MGDSIDDDFADSLQSTCRAAVGDSLRAVVYFTSDDHEIVYVRSDLYEGDEELLDTVNSYFVDNERLGFESQEQYNELMHQPHPEPDFGDYNYTLRVFDKGYLSRVIVGDRGVFLTTDGHDINEFRELAVTLRKMLGDDEG